MRSIWKTFKEKEEEKPSGWESRTRGIGVLPDVEEKKEKSPIWDTFVADVGVGVGVKAMPSTKPVTPIIEGLPVSRPEDKPVTDLPGVSERMRGIGEVPTDYPFEGVTIEMKKAQKRFGELWRSGLTTTEDKWKFLKHENWSEELILANREMMILSEKASKMGVNIKDWINYGVYMTFFASMAASILPVLSGLPKNILNNLAYKVEGKTVKGKELFNAIRRVAYPDPRAGFGAPSKFDKEIFKVFKNKGGLKGLGGSLEKGITITEVTPRFAFGTKLYGGLPADEIVKSLVKAGKVTAEMVKGLDPAKVSQVTQQLLNINPALANEFLKAVEKPELVKLIPKEEVLEKVVEPEVKEAIPKVEPKAPWQMTKKEYIGDTRYIESAKDEHIQSVVEALREGKTVPTEVLADYPDLKVAPKPPTITEPTPTPEAKAVEPAPPLEVPRVEVKAPIPKALEPLAEEARKYGSAEEFGGNTPDYISTKTGKLLENISDPKDWKDLTIKELIDLKNNNPSYVVSAKIVSGRRGGVSRQNIAVNKLLLPDNLTDFYNQATAKPVEKVEVKPVVKREVVKPEKVEVEPIVELASPTQIKQAHTIANSKALISEKGKMKPQYRKIAEIFTGVKSIKDMTPEQAEMFIDQLNRLPEPKYKNGKLVAPSIPITTKLTTQDFFKKKYGEPTPIWLLTDQAYYATKLGIKPLVEPFEKGKQEFDLEFRQSSNLVDRMVNKLNKIAKTPMGDRIKSKVKNIPTKAESNMAGLLNKHEATPPGLTEKEADIFKYFRNLSKDIWRRENEVREKVDLPPIKYKTAYFRHTADAMAKEMLEGKYPFPQGIKYWSEKMVGKKIFNPMEFQRKLSDDLIDLWSKDIRAVTKAMLWNGLKEIYLAQPSKFLNEQLNAISKDLPEYKNLTPREQLAYDQTKVMPASTKKWLVNYINQVIKGQENELDASLNRIITKSGLKGLFDKVLSPFGRSIGRKPITNVFALSGRMIISGVMGWVPRQIIRNAFQQTQNLALYGVKATIKAFLPAGIDKNLKGLLTESIFMKSYTGFEELPADLMGKLEKAWLYPYGVVANNNAKQGMKAAYWNVLELIKNPKFKKHGWADPQRTKDTPKGFLYPSEKEKLLKEMEFGASCTQYQYIPIGMPGVFRYKALIPLTRLQSWWMNYFTKFNREAIHRGFKGRPSWSGEDGPTLPWSRRVNYLKYLIIGGALLTALGYKKSFMLGVAPTYLSPAGQVALGLYNYATATEDWQKKRALRQIYYSWKAFIPGSLAWRDFLAVWNGEKELEEILFYGKREAEKKKKPVSDIWKDFEGTKGKGKSTIWETF